MKSNVRVRFAPSPTGYPHLGNIRTALFNWLFARHNNGTFIIRIEDTDVARKVDGATESILESLRWLGLNWDEGPEVGGDFGPYFQSQRLEIYHKVAQQLVDEGYAYKCYCSTERLQKMREEQTKNSAPTGYDRRCRNLSNEERTRLEQQGITPVVRFKFPLEGETRFNDLIRGEVVFQNSLMDDFVLLKSDGYPTYHLANIIDDHLMQISHVLRADEWLSSTPRHIQLYQAMGYEPPIFAHLPIILGPDRAKLSKRHGATSVLEYRDLGYLPEALVNFLSLLGWSLDDKTEIIPIADIIAHFSLERVRKTGAIFSRDKLDWMNGIYMRALTPEQFTAKALPFIEKGLPAEIKRPISRDYLLNIAPLIQDRVKLLKDTTELVEFFFNDNLTYDHNMLLGKNMTWSDVVRAIERTLAVLHDITEWEEKILEQLIRPMTEELNLKASQYFGILRVATTGRAAAPPLFQTMAVLGKERCLNRIEKAREIASHKAAAGT